jgi:hypothetical protein
VRQYHGLQIKINQIHLYITSAYELGSENLGKGTLF